MALGLAKQTEVVLPATRLRTQSPSSPEHSPPPSSSIVQVYDETNGELLILGEPSAGKSTLLLELAQHLVNLAEQDTEQPLPVIIPLSSWAQKRLRLQDWLAEQVALFYDIPSRLSQTLVQNDQILPLLDGLDEVPDPVRGVCIDAINAVIILLGQGIGLSFGLVMGLSNLDKGLNAAVPVFLFYILSVGIPTGLIYWLLIGLFRGIESETIDDQHRETPGQGIRRSAYIGSILGLASGIVCVPIYLASEVIGLAVTLWRIEGRIDPSISSTLLRSLPYGLLFALAGGLLVALLKGGLAWFQHAILNLLLWYSGSFPNHYKQFLEMAARRILLRKEGAGYTFIHHLFLDYFATLDTTVPSNAS